MSRQKSFSADGAWRVSVIEKIIYTLYNELLMSCALLGGWSARKCLMTLCGGIVEARASLKAQSRRSNARVDAINGIKHRTTEIVRKEVAVAKDKRFVEILTLTPFE